MIEALSRYADLRPRWRVVYTGLLRISQTRGGLPAWVSDGQPFAFSLGHQFRGIGPMTQLPLWAQWLQFIATIGIAAFAGLIATLGRGVRLKYPRQPFLP